MRWKSDEAHIQLFISNGYAFSIVIFFNKEQKQAPTFTWLCICMYKCDDFIALIPIKQSFSRVNAQMIAEITFINLATPRKTMNYFQIEFANDVSGLCDI